MDLIFSQADRSGGGDGGGAKKVFWPTPENDANHVGKTLTPGPKSARESPFFVVYVSFKNLAIR